METTERDVLVERVDAQLRAQDAAVERACRNYRIVAVRKPFRVITKEVFNHLSVFGEYLSLCEGIAIGNPAKLPPARLEYVDCIACLDEFTKRTRPAGSWLA
jgi:hypothetical protein